MLSRSTNGRRSIVKGHPLSNRHQRRADVADLRCPAYLRGGPPDPTASMARQLSLGISRKRMSVLAMVP